MEAVLAILWSLIIFNFLVLLYELRIILYSKFAEPISKNPKTRQTIELGILIILIIITWYYITVLGYGFLESFRQYLESIATHIVEIDLGVKATFLVAIAQLFTVVILYRQTRKLSEQTNTLLMQHMLNLINSITPKLKILYGSFYITSNKFSDLKLPECNDVKWREQIGIINASFIKGVKDSIKDMEKFIKILDEWNLIPEYLSRELDNVLQELSNNLKQLIKYANERENKNCQEAQLYLKLTKDSAIKLHQTIEKIRQYNTLLYTKITEEP